MSVILQKDNLVETFRPDERDEFIIYPDSDGEPMADNDLQFEWITTLKWNLDDMFRENPNVYVAGDMLWYPVERHPEIRMAPDAFVVFGRPKGYRGSYKQFRENGIAPQVVFEVISPGNRPGEMERKREFYERYGVQEYYVLDPDSGTLEIYLRSEEGILEEEALSLVFTSPLLGVRCDRSGPIPVFYRADGERFRTFMEVMEAERETRTALQTEEERANAEAARAEAANERAERLAARLRELGIDPNED